MMKDKPTATHGVALTTIPAKAVTTYQDCKAFSCSTSQRIQSDVAAQLKTIGFNNVVAFADIVSQPFYSQDENPYDTIMEILRQFGSIAASAYDTSIKNLYLLREIEALKVQLNDRESKQ
ncbi:hypothetical protein LJC45_02705 [Alistipes sp. OttesenSCG-928-B03]|nr:hypothetical protein [Alistipes sp. OttesenSCG-928-B03]